MACPVAINVDSKTEAFLHSASTVITVPIELKDVKTPLVPHSKMFTQSSTMGSAEEKRKAVPDALAAPYAKKRATSDASTGLTIEDKTHLECFSASTGLCKELDCRESDEESDTLSNTNPDEDKMFVYDTIGPGDVTALEKALAATYPPPSSEYTKRCDVIKEMQLSYEEVAKEDIGYTGKLRVEVLLDKEGDFIFSFFHNIIAV